MALLGSCVLIAACGGSGVEPASGPPPCGSGRGEVEGLIAGPEAGPSGASLARLARQYDRQFHVFNALGTGLNSDLWVPLEAVEDRAKIERFLREDDGFDFEAVTGTSAVSVIGHWQKSAGAYAGASLAADAFRYGVLRDRGDACEEVALARVQLERSLAGAHLAVKITGAPGVIARSILHTGLPHAGAGEILPLFDESGRALPLEKDNGTWRADGSGELPDFIWEDSTSRDMLIGWALGFASAYEVIAQDETIDPALIAALRADALAIGNELKRVRPSGYDLEIIDADGRTTFHGYLNERAFERLYLEESENGFHAALALGAVATMSYVSGDAGLRDYLVQELLEKRDLPGVAARTLSLVDMGEVSNFSNYNMAFTGLHLAHRYVADAEAEGILRVALEHELYARPGRARQPVEMGVSFYDLVYVAGAAGATATHGPTGVIDQAAVTRGVETLSQFPEPPYWERGHTNCDEAEIASGRCTLDDGTEVVLLGNAGRGEKLIADRPVPMRVRPASNYHWRSNPYAVNDEADGSRLLPGSDFRLAYWMGRWIRR